MINDPLKIAGPSVPPRREAASPREDRVFEALGVQHDAFSASGGAPGLITNNPALAKPAAGGISREASAARHKAVS